VADESYIYAVLAADSGVTALVSTRIYDQRAPESSTATTPYIVGRVVADVSENDMDGGGSAYFRIQFDIVATTKASAKAIVTAMRAALTQHGYELTTLDGLDDVTDLRRVISDWGFWLPR
jgi:hypothetical protein